MRLILSEKYYQEAVKHKEKLDRFVNRFPLIKEEWKFKRPEKKDYISNIPFAHQYDEFCKQLKKEYRMGIDAFEDYYFKLCCAAKEYGMFLFFAKGCDIISCTLHLEAGGIYLIYAKNGKREEYITIFDIEKKDDISDCYLEIIPYALQVPNIAYMKDEIDISLVMAEGGKTNG